MGVGELQLLREPGELARALERERAAGARVGLVPTMGALHAGHRSLVERAVTAGRRTVVSIFVNPLQFGPGEDLASYPRSLEEDLRLAEAAGAAYVFAPSAAEMYPEPVLTTVRVAGLTERWEGAVRPGHFEGVTTVLARLFNLTGPCRAYFGEKDFQQLAVVRRMVFELRMPVELEACPIVREPDGLALSSRNRRLDPAARAAAPVLHLALEAGAALLDAGERDPGVVSAAMTARLQREPLAEPDYAVAVDPGTLEVPPAIDGPVRLLVAARLGGVRLLDNRAAGPGAA